MDLETKTILDEIVLECKKLCPDLWSAYVLYDKENTKEETARIGCWVEGVPQCIILKGTRKAAQIIEIPDCKDPDFLAGVEIVKGICERHGVKFEVVSSGTSLGEW